jgi:glycolate oxidase FAD binding subunit
MDRQIIMMTPESVEELREIVQQEDRIAFRGGGSKSGLLSLSNGAAVVEMTRLSRILEYEPGEYTFTALAGTPIVEIEAELAKHDQYLPFDPVFAGQGATLGGTVASGLNGPGRYRYGGIRDFILGVRFVNTDGEIIQSGGRVVKNAAGFDISKLMVGSLGQYGGLVALNFKVFPRPESFTTIQSVFPSLEESLSSLQNFTNLPLDIHALDLVSCEGGFKILIRLSGSMDSLPPRVKRAQEILKGGDEISGEQEYSLWYSASEFNWVPQGCFLIKIPITPKDMFELDGVLERVNASRRYSAGANVAWIAWPGKLMDLENYLLSVGLAGLVVMGEADKVWVGRRTGQSFAKRVKNALDPIAKWVEV